MAINYPNIIGLCGKHGAGKDTFAKMLQVATRRKHGFLATSSTVSTMTEWKYYEEMFHQLRSYFTWETKSHADKLKQCGALILGVPRIEFEKQEFKQSNLGEDWDVPNPEAACGLRAMTVREFLQKFGTDAVRDHLHSNTWVNALWADYKKLSPTYASLHPSSEDESERWPKWIVTDVRFPNEVKAITDRGGYIVRILNQRTDKRENEHISESNIDKISHDYEVRNYGDLEELFARAKELAREFRM